MGIIRADIQKWWRSICYHHGCCVRCGEGHRLTPDASPKCIDCNGAYVASPERRELIQRRKYKENVFTSKFWLTVVSQPTQRQHNHQTTAASEGLCICLINSSPWQVNERGRLSWTWTVMAGELINILKKSKSSEDNAHENSSGLNDCYQSPL